jgi:hypothetical protein
MKYSVKRRKPDLMTVLILVVALGVVITLSAQAKVDGRDEAPMLSAQVMNPSR